MLTKGSSCRISQSTYRQHELVPNINGFFLLGTAIVRVSMLEKYPERATPRSAPIRQRATPRRHRAFPLTLHFIGPFTLHRIDDCLGNRRLLHNIVGRPECTRSYRRNTQHFYQAANFFLYYSGLCVSMWLLEILLCILLGLLQK